MIDISKRRHSDGSPLSPTEEIRALGPTGALLNFLPQIQLRLTCVASPVQLEGTIDGYPVYFRSRHSDWSLHFYRHEAKVESVYNEDVIVELSGYYDPARDGFSAGTMPLDVACSLIEAGIMAFRRQLRIEAGTEGDTI